jgi:hypothetical protein
MKIGKSEVELDVEKITECRHIVKNLVNFGLCEKQKLQLIYLLSLELESRDAMKKIVKLINDLQDESKFNLTKDKKDYNNNKPKIIDV